MRDLSRRLRILEKLPKGKARQFNPEYLAAISDDDLAFVANLPIPEGDSAHVSLDQLTESERARLSDILRRMNHGPDA